MNRQLSIAYAVCRGVARTQAKNFYYAFLALPREKRNALCAVYAFMRHADDIADDPGLPYDQRREQLARWSEALHAAADGCPSDDPVIMALADAQRRFSISIEYFDQLVHGTAMDLDFERARQVHRHQGYFEEAEREQTLSDDAHPAAQARMPMLPYATFEELYGYCYHVASVVGLVCIRIFGYSDPRAEALAEKTGVAFQLTNIIRDVKEDALMGRIYLPAEDLARFGRSQSELTAKSLSNGFDARSFRPLLQLQAERARSLYAAADELMPLIDEDSRPCLWVLVNIYRRLLAKIEERDYNVFAGKIRLSTGEKLKYLGKGLLQVMF